VTRNKADLAERRGIVVAGLLGALGVALGAFGAHGLKAMLADVSDVATRLEWWDKAARYQMWHALLVGLLASRADASRSARVGIILAVVGVLLFSGSLYAMTLTGVRALGAITPLGGLAFLGAWGAWAWSAWSSSNKRDARTGGTPSVTPSA
jgi:uncharacterized membrane protein YgdD (TMEM256/DUF423 family)